MAYSTDLREKVMEFLQKGHRVSQAEEAFGISGFAIRKWRRKLEETGNLGDGPRRATFRKPGPDKLKAHVCGRPDAYLKEMG